MKKYALLLSAFLVCIKVAATTEHPYDFSVSTSEHTMSFKIVSSVNKTVSLSGDQEYDDGDYYYDPAVELKLGDIPYNLVIPEIVSYENTSYNVVSIDNGAFGNGARKSTDKVSVHYLSMDNVNSIYSLTLPSTITSINSMPNQIKILKCCATTPPALNKSIPSSCSVIYVPTSSLSAYKSASVWSNYADKMVGYDPSTNLISDISFSQKTYTTNTVSTIQLAPSVIPSASASNITWSSTDSSVATVNSSGLVSGKSVGECYITATSSDGSCVFSTVKITVVQAPPISNISLNETSKTLYLNEILNTVTLIPTITPSESAGAGVTWSSSNSSVAVVDQSGVVTAIGDGAATITCTANDESGISANCQITVKELSSKQVGYGTYKKSTVPFHTDNPHNEVFMKYTANELENAGKIKAISFFQNYEYGKDFWLSLEIWMGKQEDPNFYNNTYPSANMLKDMIRVYQGQIKIKRSDSDTQINIILDTPYEYDGASDLNIFIASNLDNSNTSLKYYSTYGSSNTVKYRGSEDGVTNTMSWTTSRYRPNTLFWMDDCVRSINHPDISVIPISSVVYSGSAMTPAVIVQDGSTILTNGTDYTVSYSNNINAGTATATITGMGNYTGTKNANFTINPKNASNLTINSIAAQTYSGSAKTPTVTVKDGSTTLTSGTHYTVAYSNNTNAGTATVTITGMGNYTGTKNANFTINPKNASNLTINSIAAQTYSGSAKTPTVTVKDGSTTLTSGTHYTVAYSNNTNAGTATVTITGMGNYTGTKNANFTINPKNASNLTINSIAAQTYSGSAKTPTITVKDGSTTLTSGTHYTVSYSNNTNAGTATVTVTGKGNYTGTKNASFTIQKAPLTITAKSYTIDQYADLPAFEVEYSGFVNGEDESVLTTQPILTCDADNSETVGDYAITPSGAIATNYSITYMPGTLTINSLPESVSIAMKTGSGADRTMIGYSSQYGLDFTGINDVRAYIVFGFTDTKNVLMARVNIVPANTGIVLKSDVAGVEVEVPITTSDVYYANALKPAVNNVTIYPNEYIGEVNYTNLMVGTLNNQQMGFVTLSSSKAYSNKSYLQVPTAFYNGAASAREGGLEMVFVDDETTDIRSLMYQGGVTNDAYYDLQGRKVIPGKKGIYIHNGKKVIVK